VFARAIDSICTPLSPATDRVYRGAARNFLLYRVDVVFRFWQCDKENHGWREGPPLTAPAKIRSAGRAFTLW